MLCNLVAFFLLRTVPCRGKTEAEVMHMPGPRSKILDSQSVPAAWTDFYGCSWIFN